MMTSTKYCLFVLVFYITVERVRCADILLMFDKSGSSHFHDAAIIAKVLKNHGHNITFLIPARFQNESSVKKYESLFSIIYATKFTEGGGIDVVKASQDVQVKWGTVSMETIKLPVRLVMGTVEVYLSSVSDLMSDLQLAETMMSSQFDMVLFEGSFVWLHPFVHKLNIPYALLTTCAPSSVINAWFHLPNLPAILPGFMIHRHHRKQMSFFSRVISSTMTYGSLLYFSFMVDVPVLRLASEYDVTASVSPVRSFGLADMWLTNADYTTDVPRPYLPNMAMVGGLSIKEAKPLSPEMKHIIDRAGVHGLLVVSMGTVVKGVSQEQIDSMAAAFARLPQTVLWKEPVPRPRYIGNNTILKSWLSQNDLLAHPKTRAMVYHCGNNGAFEALYHGIPIIGVPVFADQIDVAYRIMSNGMGLVVELPALTNDTMFQAVSEVINNPKYLKRAKYLSAVYRDNPHAAPERAAFWIEYVLRHRGARLMKAKVSGMNLVQEYMLDVWIFIIGVTVTLAWYLKKVFKYCLGSL